MTRPFAALERLIERLFERPAARIFRASAEPVQVRIRLEHAMDDARRTAGGRSFAPHVFEVRLAPADAAALQADEPGLEVDLAADLLRYARQRGYRLAAQPRVRIVGWPGLGPAEVQVVAGAPGASGGSAAGDPRPAPAVPAAPAAQPGPATSAASSIRHMPVRPRQHDVGQGAAPWPTRRLEATAILQVPRPPSSILLVVSAPDQPPREVLLEGPTCTLGRAGDNDLVLPDSRVSRHHGRITVRHGALVYVDLGSTNGSRVNGEVVQEVALGTGDVLQIGATTISVLSRA